MKKIILFFLVLLMGTSSVSAKLLNVDFSYTTSQICDYDYNCYPVYYMSKDGQQLYFLNHANNFNISFSEYSEVPIDQTPFSPLTLDYVASSIFIKDSKYYREVMTQKLWELFYNETFEIAYPQSMEILELSKRFNEIVSKLSSEPLFKQKSYFITNKTPFTMEGFTSNLYEIVADSKLVINTIDDKIVVSGPPGEYTVTIKPKNSGNNLPQIYTDGTNYLIKEGNFNEAKEYSVNLIVDMKKVSIKLSASNGEIANEDIKVYHNNVFYKTLKTDELGEVNTYLPIGEIELKDGQDNNLKSFTLTDTISLNITKYSPKENDKNNIVPNTKLPFPENNQISKEDKISEKENIKPNEDDKTGTSDTIQNNQLITNKITQDEIEVILPDTLCI